MLTSLCVNSRRPLNCSTGIPSAGVSTLSAKAYVPFTSKVRGVQQRHVEADRQMTAPKRLQPLDE